MADQIQAPTPPTYLTAAEHRAQAEDLFARAKRGLPSGYLVRDETETVLDTADVMAEAQLHATLAVAAALIGVDDQARAAMHDA